MLTKTKTYGYQERNEEEREAFKEKLSKIEKKRYVYVDEARFDNRQNYPYDYSLLKPLILIKHENCWSKVKNILRSIEARTYKDLDSGIAYAFPKYL